MILITSQYALMRLVDVRVAAFLLRLARLTLLRFGPGGRPIAEERNRRGRRLEAERD